MQKTTIEWTDRVWNFLTGCTKITQGCKFCYMFILAMRLKAMGQEKYRNGTKLTIHESEIANPYHWKKPSMVFVNSMSDIFHEEVPDSVIIAAWKVMNETPQHTYQILTKRAERLLEIQDKLLWSPNIWMGVSVENNEVLHRVDILRNSKALVKWISAEPLIGALSDINLEGIHWLVAGAESGISKNVRPAKEEWFLELLQKCRERSIPFFFKQWGKKQFNPNPSDPTMIPGDPNYAKGGCQLKGEIYREFPIINNSNEQNIKPINMKTEKSTSETTKIVSQLSPFKKIIGVALLRGENPEALASRLSLERRMPRRTAQAYVTMVGKTLNNGLAAPKASLQEGYAIVSKNLTGKQGVFTNSNSDVSMRLLSNDFNRQSDAKVKFSKMGFEYFISGFPIEEQAEQISIACSGKDTLADLTIALSKEYCIYVEKINHNENLAHGNK